MQLYSLTNYILQQMQGLQRSSAKVCEGYRFKNTPEGI